MGIGRTLREWEGLGILKTIPAHLYLYRSLGDEFERIDIRYLRSGY